MTADGHELVELEIWSASPHEIGFGPRLHASPDVLARWIDVAAAACAGIFGGTSAWFVADWERARTWAFPDSFEPEHRLDNGGQEIRVARAPGCSVDLFATLMRSHDVGWDAIAIVDGTFTAADIVPLLRPWQQAIDRRDSTLRPPGDMLFTSGDGLVLRWSNARRTAAELREAVLRIPGVHASTKR